MQTIKQLIEQDIKQAMLAGDKTLVTTLRGLKSAILYDEVAKGKREQGLSEDATIDVLSKEAKKRLESADMYTKGGSTEKADAEIAEKAVIDKYLPAQMTDEELKNTISEVIQELGASSKQDMGRVIQEVKKRSQGQAEGSRIALMVKEKLQ